MKLPGRFDFGVLTLSAALVVAGALAAPAFARERKAPPVEITGPAGDYPVTLGEPFLIDGVTYTPADTLNYDAVGTAVLLATSEATARVSGAHRLLPVPSYVEVTSLDTGRTVLVRLDQRGPMSGDGLVALSPMAWTQLGLPAIGSAPVRVRRVNPPEQDRALLRTGQTAPLRMDTPPGLLAALKRKLGVEPPVGNLPLTVKPSAIAATHAPPLPSPLPLRKPAPQIRPETQPAPKSGPLPATKPGRAAQAPSPAETPLASEPAAPKPAAPKPAASTARYYVQIGAFAQRGNADAAARKAGGLLVRAGNLWRVRSGPFSTGTEADGALAKARRAGYAGARTVRE
ncbi:MAG: SPOR domain-containing protein [Novosphingobium sp.]